MLASACKSCSSFSEGENEGKPFPAAKSGSGQAHIFCRFFLETWGIQIPCFKETSRDSSEKGITPTHSPSMMGRRKKDKAKRSAKSDQVKLACNVGKRVHQGESRWLQSLVGKFRE